MVSQVAAKGAGKVETPGAAEEPKVVARVGAGKPVRLAMFQVVADHPLLAYPVTAKHPNSSTTFQATSGVQFWSS